MPTVSVRIDEELVSAARFAAKAEFRTVQGQVEFWAKVGRAALDNPDLPASFIAESLMSMVDQLVDDVDAAVDQVVDNPDIGEKKKGDLATLWVHKFRSHGQLYLLGYTRDDVVRLVYLESVGPHENFYRDLKR